MKDLTTQEKATLLSDVKSFLDITWEDDATDTKLMKMIISAIRWVDDVAGYELNYLVDENTEGDATYLSLCFAGRELMMYRVFYTNEKALDDFDGNFISLINGLVMKGRVYATTQTESQG